MARGVVHPDTYLDSVLLLAATRAMTSSAGRQLGRRGHGHAGEPRGAGGAGFAAERWPAPRQRPGAGRAGPTTTRRSTPPWTPGDEALFAARPAARAARPRRRRQPRRGAARAARRQRGHHLGPGAYAALEAHKALGAGPARAAVQRQRAGRRGGRAQGAGRPARPPGDGTGAGTAVLGGCGLGFANVVRRGPGGRGGRRRHRGPGGHGPARPVGRGRVAGHRGRRSRPVARPAGRMAGAAVARPRRRPGTEVDPAGVEAAGRVGGPGRHRPAAGTPVVAAPDRPRRAGRPRPPARVVTPTLEGGARPPLAALGRTAPDATGGLRERSTAALARPRRPSARLVAASTPAARSATRRWACWASCSARSTPTSRCDKRYGLPAPEGAHVLPRPRRGGVHPGAAPPDDRPRGPPRAAARGRRRTRRGGHPARRRARLRRPRRPGRHARAGLRGDRRRGGPAVVAYVLGTEGDPQGLEAQRAAPARRPAASSPPTGARAALAAAAIALRRPELVEALP